MLDRRRFLGGAAASGLLSVVGSPFAGATTEQGMTVRDTGYDSRLIGWQSPSSDRLDCAQLDVEGRMPEGLHGFFRRNGPAGHDRYGLRYSHWFDGDGMIQEFRIADGGISHRGRMIMTPKLSREVSLQRRIYPATATHLPDAVPIRRPDDMNTANISVLDHHGELLALWEGGSPSVIDRESLEWSGFKSWSDQLKGVPFTAHPKVEADGTLWAFGSAIFPRPMIVLYHIDAAGRLVRAGVVPVDPMGMVHDFVVTERQLAIVIPPFVHEPGHGRTFLDSHVWRPDLGTRVLIVSKDDFAERRWVQIPEGFGFHHGNGWEEKDGTLRFDHCTAADASLVTTAFRNVMNGKLSSVSTPRYSGFALHPSGRVEIEDSGLAAEFPRINLSLTGRRNRFVYLLGAAEHPDWFLRRVMKQDKVRGTVEEFDYGEGTIAEEHIFVPSPEARAEDDGWLLGTFLAHRKGLTGLSVFDARRISDGPIARAWLPYPLPLGFHGQFMPG